MPVKEQVDEEAARSANSLISDESSPLLKKKETVGEWSFMMHWIIFFGGCFFLIAMGVMAVMSIEGWHFVTSLYVVVQIVTTIGYGDFTVQTERMKLFCAFYVVLTLIFVAYALNLAVAWMQGTAQRKMRKFLRSCEVKAFKATQTLSKFSPRTSPTSGDDMTHHPSQELTRAETKELVKQIKNDWGAYNELAVATLLAIAAVAFGTIFYATYENCTCSYGKSQVEGCKEGTLEECIATGGYQKSWVSSFYMSVITLTTVGFGDHSPRSWWGRVVGIVWMLVGVAFTANWIGSMTAVFFESSRQNLVVETRMSKDIFDKMDKDGSGALSREEFQCYFLVKNGLVSQEDLDLIDAHYDKIDTLKNNKVTFDMISQSHDE